MTDRYGIDVSHYQSTAAPGGVPWPVLARDGCSFAMVRATYGTMRDSSAPAHVAAARAAGIAVGLYHFFRISQSVTDQLAAFNAQALACGMRVGDIAPAVDLEDDGSPVAPSWSEPARVLADGMVANFGECILYITQRAHGMLGKPPWVIERPLWVAHYTGAAAPATPSDAPWAMWQHRVGPWVMSGVGGAYAASGKPASRVNGPPGPLDQSRARLLPVCARIAGATGSTPPPEQPDTRALAQEALWWQRLSALTVDAGRAVMADHDNGDPLTGAETHPDTIPSPPPGDEA